MNNIIRDANIKQEVNKMGRILFRMTQAEYDARLKEAREIKARTDKHRASWKATVAAGFRDLPPYAASEKTSAVFMKRKE